MGNTNKKEIESRLCSFRDIFDSEWSYYDKDRKRCVSVSVEKIVIPMIQRDYAQGRNVSDIEDIRNAFLDTLYNSINDNTEVILDFVYGDIDSNGVMTPLDGQQRLTTLFLLHWYASRFSKEPVSENKWEFLKRFSYETRADARIFCQELCKFLPQSPPKKLSETITDQTWFLLQWKDDATISSMLVMLDAIHDKFHNLTDTWKKLTDDKLIKFYFLPIRDMGETDNLYIRMNSRGKPLTKFEHFKAELEKCISQVYEKEETEIIMRKIDINWTNMLWTYCKKDVDNPENAIIDNEFLSYFYFICDIIYYKAAYKNNIPYTRNWKELKLLSMYFSSNNAKENIDTLVSFFDCWCDIETLFKNEKNEYKTPKEFQESFLSKNHQSGKVMISSTDTDIFGKCLKASRTFKDYKVESSFSLGDTIRLYAITLYLLNKKLLTEDQFVRRFRSVNNLILNSENEVADRTQNSNMPGIIKQTEELILNGRIDQNTGFNTYQVNEEIKKLEFTEHHHNKAELLFELEDHHLLKGQIGIVGLDYIDYTERFKSLFNCDLCLISRALMSIGNYGQRVKDKYYQFGTSSYPAWIYMFHIRQENKDSYRKNTHNALLQLLSEYEYFDNNILKTICDKFIKFCKESSKYPWRYYYVKYNKIFSMDDTAGKYYREDDGDYSYIWMPGKIVSRNSHNPFLYKAVVDYNWSVIEYKTGDRHWIVHNDVQVYCYDNSYVFKYNNKQFTVKIKQNNGIDTEDRITVLECWIKKINNAVTNNTLDSLFK